MQTYKELQPTGFDARGLGLEDRQDWYVCPVIRDRDSGCLAESNFATALELLGGESDTVETHSFNHWGHGWFEIILVHPDRKNDVEALENKLENYPLLNEGDYSRRQYESAILFWLCCSLKERMYWCKRYDVSIFAARRDEIPSDKRGELISALSDDN
jgi:hypothetical protein